MCGSVIGALWLSRFADLFGHKTVLHAACWCYLLPQVVLIFTRSFTVDVLVFVVYGLGNGTYTAVIWMLLSDLLEQERFQEVVVDNHDDHDDHESSIQQQQEQQQSRGINRKHKQQQEQQHTGDVVIRADSELLFNNGDDVKVRTNYGGGESLKLRGRESKSNENAKYLGMWQLATV